MTMWRLTGRIWCISLVTTAVLNLLMLTTVAVPPLAIDVAAILAGATAVLITGAYGRELFLAAYSGNAYETAELSPPMSRGRLALALMIGALPACYLIPAIRHHAPTSLVIAAIVGLPTLYRIVRR